MDASLRPLCFYEEEEEEEREEMFPFSYAPDQTNCPTETVESHSHDIEQTIEISFGRGEGMKLRYQR